MRRWFCITMSAWFATRNFVASLISELNKLSPVLLTNCIHVVEKMQKIQYARYKTLRTEKNNFQISDSQVFNTIGSMTSKMFELYWSHPWWPSMLRKVEDSEYKICPLIHWSHRPSQVKNDRYERELTRGFFPFRESDTQLPNLKVQNHLKLL